MTPDKGRRQRIADRDRWSTEIARLLRTEVSVVESGRVATVRPSNLSEWRQVASTLQITSPELRRWDDREEVVVERLHGPYRVRVVVPARVLLDEDAADRTERARAAAEAAL